MAAYLKALEQLEKERQRQQQRERESNITWYIHTFLIQFEVIAFKICKNLGIDVYDWICFFRIWRRKRKDNKDEETCKMK